MIKIHDRFRFRFRFWIKKKKRSGDQKKQVLVDSLPIDLSKILTRVVICQ